MRIRAPRKMEYELNELPRPAHSRLGVLRYDAHHGPSLRDDNSYPRGGIQARCTRAHSRRQSIRDRIGGL